ncbi:hypothetical protein Q4I30_006836 [Leishmania utingensis]|uniref:Uncharacterized protein n=1 Tax=Leishmania utingensis TaxID=653362 RepID=A0AAW3A2Y3_9TRYP
MSEVLLKQLQQVLAPWDSLPDKDNLDEGGGVVSSLWTPPSPPSPSAQNRDPSSSTSPSPLQLAPKCPSVEWPVEGAANAYVEHSRVATTKLELARAALALFASNAGVYRPFLVRLLRFLFDHVDELRQEQGQLRMDWWMRQQGLGSSTAKTAGGGGGELEGATPEEQNAVAAAYEKVRATESRMAALVEEAAVQRDHFKSQMEMQKRHQHHLEDLLRHQMEMTQMLLDHRLRQDLISGKQSAAVTLVTAVTHSFQGNRSVVGASLGVDGGDDSHETHEASNPAKAAALTTRDILGLECYQAPIRPPERRDAAYVQRLISRAEKELLLERTEDQLRELRVQHEAMQDRIQSLLKLNSRYARQSVELSARLSILHEHNVALATDVHLFQRDYLREQQRTERLQRDLQGARGIVLTMLQVQFGQQEASKEDRSELQQAETTGSHLSATDNGSDTRMHYAFETAAHVAPAATTVVTDPEEMAPALGCKVMRSEEKHVTLATEDHAQEALHLASGKGLCNQLQGLLRASDPQHADVKASLLEFLHLRGDAGLQGSRNGNNDFFFSSSPRAQGWLSPASVPQWVPPYGLRSDVPLQLRSRTSVPLLQLHPIVAEAFVHELLSQRQELLWFSQQQLKERQAVLRATDGRACHRRGSRRASTTMAAAVLTSFQEYIGLFVLVVLLNRSDYYTYRLSPAARTRLDEDARAGQGSRGGFVCQTATHGNPVRDSGVAPQPRDQGIVCTSLWDLRHILCTMRTADMEQLPVEGLQLTYALDRASLQLSAGPLTYAYGLASRGTVCDVLFDLLRAERFVFVELCRAVEADLLAKTQAEQERWAEALRQDRPIHVVRSKDPQLHGADQAAAALPSPPAGRRSSTPLRGRIPVAQVARILLAMYPGYSTTIMEQLIRSAVADGTNAAENPVILFYEVLLPSRMLPGPTASSMSIDPSMAVGTSFASLFYTAICDDALESMQMVEDSVCGFARGQPQSSGMSALLSTGAVAVASGATTATAQQLTSLAFLGVPRVEAQCWGPFLRSAIYRWPLLRATVADGPLEVLSTPIHDAALGEDAGTTDKGPALLDDEIVAMVAVAGTSGRSSPASSIVFPAVTPSLRPTLDLSSAEDAKAAAEVSPVARVSVEEVVPYLRQHLLLRRGLYDWAAGTAAAAAPVDISPPSSEEESQATPIALKKVVAESARGASTTGTKERAHDWSAAHGDLLQYWDAQWAQFSGVTAASPSPFVGPTEPAELKRMLKQIDPHRACAWGSELLSSENSLMHPVTYAWEKGDLVIHEPPARDEDDSGGDRHSVMNRKPKKGRKHSAGGR